MNLSTWVSAAPRRLFFLDGVGALYSSFMLGVVMLNFRSFFGVPVHVLKILAVIPLFFAAFDAYAWNTANGNFSAKVRIIALANIAYCLLSAGLAFAHRAEIKPLGWGYLVAEIIVVLAIARWELNVAGGAAAGAG